MNNSKLAIEYETLSQVAQDQPLDMLPALRNRETDLMVIIEAMGHIRGSQYWKILEEKVFNKDFNSLQKQLRNEKNPTEIYRLQGRITQAEKLDLNKGLQAYEAELQRIRKQLNA